MQKMFKVVETDPMHQIFILAGVFGGACVLLILAVIALSVCVLK